MASKFRGILSKAKSSTKAFTEVTPEMSEKELVGILNSLNEPEQVTPTPVVEAAPVATVEQHQVATTHKALNVYFDSAKRKYMLATIAYNPATLECEVVSIEPIADSQPTAIFKLNNIFALKIARAVEKI
jgi:hypothetical protein